MKVLKFQEVKINCKKFLQIFVHRTHTEVRRKYLDTHWLCNKIFLFNFANPLSYNLNWISKICQHHQPTRPQHWARNAFRSSITISSAPPNYQLLTKLDNCNTPPRNYRKRPPIVFKKLSVNHQHHLHPQQKKCQFA